MMDSIEEMSGHTTNNELEFSSSGREVPPSSKNQPFVSSQGSAHTQTETTDQLRFDAQHQSEFEKLHYSPFERQPNKTLHISIKNTTEETECDEQVTLSQAEIVRLKRFVAQQEKSLLLH